MKVILVAGTHSWRGKETDDWHSPGSAFCRYLQGRGVAIVGHETGGRPFVWSTNLGGFNPFSTRDLLVWEAPGANLYAYVVPPLAPDRRIPPSETVIITHSHGLQPTLFAAAKGLRIDTLIDVAGPVREDMMPTATLARPNIRRWVSIHGGRRDRWQWFGAFFDGHVGIVRDHPLAHETVSVPTADHGDVLRTPAYFPVIGEALGNTAVVERDVRGIVIDGP